MQKLNTHDDFGFVCFQGLRVAAVLGCLGTCLGAWIKVFSVDPNLFYVSFIGQSVVATSQVSNYAMQPFSKIIKANPLISPTKTLFQS